MNVRRLLQRFGAVLCLLGLSAPLAMAGPQPPAASESGPAMALAYDTAGERLLRAQSRALYASEDGRAWTRVDVPLEGQDDRITAVAAGGDGAWYVAGQGIGVLRSEDNGESWQRLSRGLPHPNITALATHATLPRTVYAVLGDDGVYRSEDAGKGWELMDKGPRGRILNLFHSDMAGSMQTGWLFAGTDRGVGRSMDCFCGWFPAGQLEGPVRSITYDPRQPKQVYAVNAAKLRRSLDGGETWEARRAPGTVTAMTFTPAGVLYVVTEEGDLLRSTDGAATWKRVDD